jgi:hypothetical protein
MPLLGDLTHLTNFTPLTFLLTNIGTIFFTIFTALKKQTHCFSRNNHTRLATHEKVVARQKNGLTGCFPQKAGMAEKQIFFK